jgi:hypothetical protein
MSIIIAGRFEEQARAEEAITALESTGFPRDRIATFFVTPAGQHDQHGTTLDPEASAGAHHAGTGAAMGAVTGTGVGVVVGLATMPVLGPGAALAGAAVGAYVGSFAGALEQMGESARSAEYPANSGQDLDERPPRKSGMLVAVGAGSSPEESSAIAVLCAQGAADIERAQGIIAQGEWNDFDPLRPPALVTPAS